MVLLRLLHIVFGVFWAGAIFTMVLFVQPVVRAAGPEGGRFMARMRERRFFDVLPVAAILTMLSGIELYRRLSAGFSPAWIRTPYGMSLTVGALAAVVAFIIGMFVMRRATLRVLDLAQEAQRAAEGPARDAVTAQMDPLRTRAMISARVVAALLLVSVVTMAVARYL
jgi:putative copper export protein